MTKLADHQSNNYVKLLAMGDSKSGKTGSLVSLVKAGYKLRIIDLDNLLDVLKGYIQKECPELINNVEYRSLRDKRKPTAEGPIVQTPTAFVQAIKMLDNWKYKDGEDEIDLGKPSDWGPDCILVIDSLSRLCDAAYDFRVPLTPKSESSGQYDARMVYGDAQDAIENVLAMLTSDSFKCNVIVIAHVLYMTLPDGKMKGFPQGVGQKLSPKIPQYFPSVVLYTNDAGRRNIHTTGNALIDLANPKPFAVDKTYPIETGLADIFTALRGKTEEDAEEPKPTKVTKLNLQRR